jgi:hypothetical protein
MKRGRGKKQECKKNVLKGPLSMHMGRGFFFWGEYDGRIKELAGKK